MSASEAIAKADALYAQASKILDPVRGDLKRLLGEEYSTDVFLQTDGWCVLFGDEYDDAQNVPISQINIDELLQMSREEALAVLRRESF